MSYNPEDDEITIYTTYTDDNRYELIGWTKNKRLMKYFLKFHNCDKIKYEKCTGSFKEINEIINTHLIEEISIHPIRTKDLDGNGIDLYAPLTSIEYNDIYDETWFHRTGSVLYNEIGCYYKQLKQKYQDALNILFLDKVIALIEPGLNLDDELCFRRCNIERDMLMSLYMVEPELFG